MYKYHYLRGNKFCASKALKLSFYKGINRDTRACNDLQSLSYYEETLGDPRMLLRNDENSNNNDSDSEASCNNQGTGITEEILEDFWDQEVPPIEEIRVGVQLQKEKYV